MRSFRSEMADSIQLAESPAKSSTTTYIVEVKTSNVEGAGTDANVFLQMFDQYGLSGPILPLKKSTLHKNKFEQSFCDEFIFDNQAKLGDVSQVKIWHDNSGLMPAWHLAYVEITDTSTNLTYNFPCHKWLSTTLDGGLIVRMLPCVDRGYKRQTLAAHRLSTPFGLQYLTTGGGGKVMNVYLPTMEYVRDTAAACLQTEKTWLRDFLGEFLGTLFLVCIIDGAVAQLVLSKGTHSNFVQVCFACGMGITFGVYLSGNTSGGHINPAVTLVMVILGRTSWTMLPIYWLAQYLGGILGAAIVFFVYYDAINQFDGGIRQVYGPQATAGIFATYPQDYLSIGGGWIDQIVGTAVLTQLVFAVTDPRNHAVPKFLIPLLVGLVVTLIGLSVGFNCGFAINPARDLGPRIFTAMAGYGAEVFTYRNSAWVWVPLLGPHIGAIVGTFVYMLFVGLHWPETFQASDIARKKTEICMRKFSRRNPSALNTTFDDQDLTPALAPAFIVSPNLPPSVNDTPLVNMRHQSDVLFSSNNNNEGENVKRPKSVNVIRINTSDDSQEILYSDFKNVESSRM